MVDAASLSGTGAAGGASGPWMERHDALLGRRGWRTWGRRRRREGSGDEGEAATARGRWRGGGGGDGQREAATRGMRRRGKVAEEKDSPKFGGGDGVPGESRAGTRMPLRMVFGKKTATVPVQGGLGVTVANSLSFILVFKSDHNSFISYRNVKPFAMIKRKMFSVN